ncbi:GTP cyclohydrolase 1 [bacterium HR32]|nr:GTP cyclohydrolase 1 [bacterium HR32]
MDGREPTARLVPNPRRGTVDRERIEAAVLEILRAIGEDPEREGLRETPRRIAEMYAELFSGLHRDPAVHLEVGFEDEEHHEMVVLKDIPFYSSCEHHLLPFHGVAHVGYVPNGRIVGISKVARVVETLARRPQVQERLTSQIADLLMDRLHAKGAAVVIEAEHLCMTMRGVKKPGSVMVTSAMRGLFRDDARTRAEFLSLIRAR